MRTMMRVLAGMAILSIAAGAGAQKEPSARVKASAEGKAGLEMVFVLDTTGSMSGLIEGAKQRIWGIVNDVMRSPSKPAVKIGLVAYRDRGDAYVTKVIPLTNDLDKVYAALMEFQADGGGDGPEDVRRALADAVSKSGWSQRAPKLAQILFLVGDAPPHDDYKDEPDTLTTTAEAVKRGMTVNTIQCGNMGGTQEVWNKIASRGEGQYFAIAQDGGVQAIATPYDGKLAELGARIGRTYMAYGTGGFGGAGGGRFRAAKAAAQSRLEAKVEGLAAPGGAGGPAGPLASAAADRAVNKALNSNAYADDLLQSIENGTVKLEKVKKEELPDELQKLSPEARKVEVEKRLAERKKIRDEIVSLSKKREAHIEAERKKRAKTSPKTAFDTAVASALAKQLARRGIR